MARKGVKRKKKDPKAVPPGMTRMRLLQTDGTELGTRMGIYACQTSSRPDFVKLPERDSSDAAIGTAWRVFTYVEDRDGAAIYEEDPF